MFPEWKTIQMLTLCVSEDPAQERDVGQVIRQGESNPRWLGAMRQSRDYQPLGFEVGFLEPTNWGHHLPRAGTVRRAAASFREAAQSRSGASPELCPPPSPVSCPSLPLETSWQGSLGNTRARVILLPYRAQHGKGKKQTEEQIGKWLMHLESTGQETKVLLLAQKSFLCVLSLCVY